MLLLAVFFCSWVVAFLVTLMIDRSEISSVSKRRAIIGVVVFTGLSVWAVVESLQAYTPVQAFVTLGFGLLLGVVGEILDRRDPKFSTAVFRRMQ